MGTCQFTYSLNKYKGEQGTSITSPGIQRDNSSVSMRGYICILNVNMFMDFYSRTEYWVIQVTLYIYKKIYIKPMVITASLLFFPTPKFSKAQLVNRVERSSTVPTCLHIHYLQRMCIHDITLKSYIKRKLLKPESQAHKGQQKPQLRICLQH